MKLSSPLFLLVLFTPASLLAEAEHVATLEARIFHLENLLLQQGTIDDDPCASAFPQLEEGGVMYYTGCNRDVMRDSTVSVETCQNGTMTVYNTSGYEDTGLFDMRISANVPTKDSWNFVCTLTVDLPHRAVCTLTFEDPPRDEGPAWVEILFRDLTVVDSGLRSASTIEGPSRSRTEGGRGGGGGGGGEECVAHSATIVGTYFYDALTNNAGVYSFYASTMAPS